MRDNLTLGKKGEEIAAHYLSNQGYSLLEKNYRAGRGEIDLIVQKENLIVFVEVKWRKGNFFGFPEEAVKTSKALMVTSTAEKYIDEKNWNGEIRFDIIAITKDKVDHFIDAF